MLKNYPQVQEEWENRLVALLNEEHQLFQSLRSAQGLEALADEVSAEQRRVQQELARLLDEVQDPPQAVGQVRALMFIERFTQEVNAKLDRLT